jgi:hypothetical protein
MRGCRSAAWNAGEQIPEPWILDPDSALTWNFFECPPLLCFHRERVKQHPPGVDWGGGIDDL